MEQVDTLKTEITTWLARTKEVANLVGRGTGGREFSLAITKLQEADHWIREAAELLQEPGLDKTQQL